MVRDPTNGRLIRGFPGIHPRLAVPGDAHVRRDLRITQVFVDRCVEVDQSTLDKNHQGCCRDRLADRGERVGDTRIGTQSGLEIRPTKTILPDDLAPLCDRDSQRRNMSLFASGTDLPGDITKVYRGRILSRSPPYHRQRRNHWESEAAG